MVLTGIKGIKVNKDSEVKKLEKQQRQVCIARNKERDRVWAENRQLHRIPLAVAQEGIENRRSRQEPLVVAHEVSENTQDVVGQSSEVSTPGSQGVTNPEQIIQDLECKRRELLNEAAEIQSAIQVIKRTFRK